MNHPHDPVARPQHYTRGCVETHVFIESLGLNFNRGNVLKYLVRAGHKPGSDELEDLRKAQEYLGFEIHRLAAARENRPSQDRGEQVLKTQTINGALWERESYAVWTDGRRVAELRNGNWQVRDRATGVVLAEGYATMVAAAHEADRIFAATYGNPTISNL